MTSPPPASPNAVTYAERAAEEGQALLEKNDLQGAHAKFAQAVALQPEAAIWHSRLAAAEMLLGNADNALRSIGRAIELDPGNAAWAEQHASILYRAGNIAAVIEFYEARVTANPQSLAAWRSLARLLNESRQFARADTVIAQALSTIGPDPALLTLQIFAQQELGYAGQAREIANRAMAHFPDHLSCLFDAKLMLPMVYASVSDLHAQRQRYTQGLSDIENMLPDLKRDPRRVYNLERSNFLLAYQGENDLDHQRRYANILGTLIQTADPQLRETPHDLRWDGGRKLRVGFVGKWFYACTAGNYFERWITRLDPTRFERFVYYTGQPSDDVTARIGTAAEHFTRLQSDVRSNALRIRADKLDILIYPEIGMSTSSYLLASLRLAPIQCAAWGHPVTTGNCAIDTFFSCGLMEPADYQNHYSERVVLLDGIGVDFAMPPPELPASRADFNLPATGRLYFCPQSIFKIHPDVDEALVNILQSDSSAVLVFFQSDSRVITMAFADRLIKTLVERGIAAKGQMKFLPRMDTGSFRKALKLADVVLDPFHWSGGGTSLDALAGDVPIVTLPGRFMRGRQTAAMLGMMGVDALIATDVDSYVKTAVDVASNRTLNNDLRATIAANKSALFDRADLNSQFSDALYALATEPPRARNGD
ncbi:MAG: hypothetical protein ABI583_05040 [Betaproteobacteria bacterium]